MPTLEELKLIGAGIMLVAAFAFAYGLKGKIDKGDLEQEQLACVAQKDAITTAAQTAANEANTHSRAVQEAMQRSNDAAVSDHQQSELALAAAVTAQRAVSSRLSNALAAAGGGSVAVPAVAGDPGGNLYGSKSALEWYGRVVAFAQQCTEEWAEQRGAVIEAKSAWPHQ
jgi:hypothetical protein